MFILVSYDIVNDDIRAEVARILLGYGRRVQKSVFECVIDEKRFLQMKEQVDSTVDRLDDSVRYYTLCRRCLGNVQITGLGTVTEDDADAIHIV
ncbi:MAG: CRISPR-associated endonuclease Cas2 [Candidatus Eremiobacterota bacterium]